MNTNETWLKLLDDLLQSGAVQPSRDGHTREILGYQTRIDMNEPVITVAQRCLGQRFLVREAAWILTGDNRVSTAPRELTRFSDDELSLNGAYGPPFVDQLPYIVRCLEASPDTRQAVATLWRPRPGPSKDIPCTVALQWLYRNGGLHCVATMRSSDAWLGIVYDWHTFSMMSAYVLLSLKMLSHRWKDVILGDLILTAGSQHLYSRDVIGAGHCLAAPHDVFDWEPYPLDAMRHPDELIAELVRRGKS